MPQETDPDLPMSIQESLVEVWVSGGLLQSWGALSVAVPGWNLHYLHHGLVPGK